MSGLYSHTTRAVGTILTAAIYNADHQNHIDNQTPQQTDDYSVDLTQSRAQTKPDTLATSLAGELERLRYVLALLGGSQNWDGAGQASGAELTNKTGGSLAANDVVALDTGNDSAVALADVQGSLKTFVVAAETITNNSAGKMKRTGVLVAKTQGTIVRGNYVRKSATTKAVEDAGVAMNGTNLPPAGTLGVAVTADASNTATIVWFGFTWPGQGVSGECRLVKSGADLALQRRNGKLLTINGAAETVPAAGVSLAPTSLTPGTTYFIYAFMSAGTMTLEASTTAHATHTDGVEIKSADATRTLVGMARIITGPAWVDTDAQRFVVSWFHRRTKIARNTLAGDRTSTSTTYVEIDSAARAEFLTWENTVLFFLAGTMWNNTGGNGVFAAHSLDGTKFGADMEFDIGTGNDQGVYAGSEVKSDLAEGYHYGSLFGRVEATTGNWLAGGSVSVMIEG